jgi:hypothetical protein
MNPKIHKLRDELAKVNAKLATLQNRKQELEKQLLEAENTDIVGLVRAQGYSLEQFAELLKLIQANPVPARASIPGKETNDHETA